jgi:hypothetical protein
MTYEPGTCPRCGSANVARLVYGLSDLGLVSVEDIEAGRVILGDRTVNGDEPEWRCLGCGYEWTGE